MSECIGTISEYIGSLSLPSSEYVKDKMLACAPPIGIVKVIAIPEAPLVHSPHLFVDVYMLPEEEQQRICECKEQVIADRKRREREADFNKKVHEDWKKAHAQEVLQVEVDTTIMKVKRTWMKAHPLDQQDGPWGVGGLLSVPQPYAGHYEPQHTKRFRRG